VQTLNFLPHLQYSFNVEDEKNIFGFSSFFLCSSFLFTYALLLPLSIFTMTMIMAEENDGCGGGGEYGNSKSSLILSIASFKIVQLAQLNRAC